MSWIIPDGESVSNSTWYGLEAIVSALAPIMTATTTKLQLQASAQPMSVLDADVTDWADVTVEGSPVAFSASDSAATADGLTTLARFNRARVSAETDAGVAVPQSGAKVITSHSVRV